MTSHHKRKYHGFSILAALSIGAVFTALLAVAPIEQAKANPIAVSDWYKWDANKLPVFGRTVFSKGRWDANDPLNTAEHELMHVIGFSIFYQKFSAVLVGNDIKVGGTVYGIIDGTSHLDPLKKVTIAGTEYDQSKDIMRPDKVVGQRVGDQDKLILNAIYNWAGIGGLSIGVTFLSAFNAADKAAINNAVTAVQNLFGPAGANPHQITWEVMEAVPIPGAFILFGSGLAIVVAIGKRRQRTAHVHGA